MQWVRINPGSPRLWRLQADTSLDGYDPYLIWADLTKFAGFSDRRPDSTGRKQVPVAIQLQRDYLRADFPGVLTAPGAYRRARYLTGLVPEDKLVDFRNLLQAGERFKLGLPGIPQVTQPAAMALSFVQVPFVVGIIDHGFAFAHRAFRNPASGKTRIQFLWDQDRGRLDAGRNPGGHWREPRDFGYGGFLDKKKIDDLVHDYPDESSVYRAVRYEPAAARFSHGTHVMDLACGRRNPLRHVRGFPNADAAANSGNFDGHASSAPIVAVQLPYRPVGDTSGASLCVHVLDAIHFIARRARSARQVVINLSDGALAGPHDGTSLLESAIDDFVDNSKFSLVVAAGNAHESDCHARQRVNAHRSGVPLKWRVLPDDYTDSHLEIWLDRAAGTDVSISIRPPGANAAKTVRMGATWMGHEGGTPHCCVTGTLASPNGPGRGHFLVSVAPTRPRTPARDRAPHGVWEITVNNNTGAAIDVDAWIERDNPALGEKGPPRQSRFVRDPACVVNTGTLNSVGTGSKTIVVGGYYARGRFPSDTYGVSRLSEVARYSSSGPGHPGTGYDGPDVSAPSDESPVLHGLRAAANRSGTTFRMDGTSVAAPVVTRRIANMLGQVLPPPLGQVRKHLQDYQSVVRSSVEPAREGAGRIQPGEEP